MERRSAAPFLRDRAELGKLLRSNVVVVNLPTTYIGNVAYVADKASLQIVAEQIKRSTAHPQALGFRGVKCIEDPFHTCRIDARPGIADCHDGAFVLLLSAYITTIF